jgi:hypothetical protein
MVGMLLTEYREAVSGELSTLSLPIFNLPLYSWASSSTIGISNLHGPHHSAQKSTSTGTEDFNTSPSKLASVNSARLLLDIKDSFRALVRMRRQGHRPFVTSVFEAHPELQPSISATHPDHVYI